MLLLAISILIGDYSFMEKKSLYLMGKLRTAEVSIDEFADELESRGHIVLAKWWNMEKLPTPYLDFPETSNTAAKMMIEAAKDSDIAILFPGDTILGAAMEFGAALGSTYTNPDKSVIVVNPFEVRQSVFYAHEAVIAVRGISRIREMDWF